MVGGGTDEVEKGKGGDERQSQKSRYNDRQADSECEHETQSMGIITLQIGLLACLPDCLICLPCLCLKLPLPLPLPFVLSSAWFALACPYSLLFAEKKD